MDPFIVELKSFSMNIPDNIEVEPFFCSLALYDLAARRKISESFNFDFNSDVILSGLPTFKNAHSFNRIRRAVFHVSQRSSNIYMVLKVFKVLQGDEDSVAEPYLKPEKVCAWDVRENRRCGSCSFRN